MRRSWLLLPGLGLLLAGCPALVHDGGIAYGMPTRISLPMPTSLTSGAGAYRIAASASGQGVRDNVNVYLTATGLVDSILAKVGAAKLVPGRSYTFPDPKQPSGSLTVLLQVHQDHATIAIGQGSVATGSSQVIGISYTDPQHGTAVIHAAQPDGKVGRYYLASRFDLVAGTVSADGVADSTAVATGDAAQQFLGHWEFRRDPAQPAAGAAFTMRAAVHLVKPSRPSDSGLLGLSANFLAGGSCAYLFGVQNAGTGDRFLLMPTDGVSWAIPTAPHAFFLSAGGDDLARAAAPAALQAIVPGDDDFHRPFPEDPATVDAFGLARFAFPD